MHEGGGGPRGFRLFGVMHVRGGQGTGGCFDERFAQDFFVCCEKQGGIG